MKFRRGKPRVVVLGCGPAGLFAVHAAMMLGADVQVISKLRRSEMYGAQSLKAEIPGLTDESEPFKVEYRMNGDMDEYLGKVYGDEIPERTGITKADIVGVHDAFDIRHAYSKAFDLYLPMIQAHDIDFDTMEALIDDRPNLIVSTIPAPALCHARHAHAFSSREIWAIGDAPERGVFAPRAVEEKDVVEYDGTTDRGWYRAANVAGYHSVEWPGNLKPPLTNVSRVTKPIANTCDCWHGSKHTKILRVGRYGEWRRQAHAHDGYYRTLDAIRSL